MAARSAVQRSQREAVGELGVPNRLLDLYIQVAFGSEVVPIQSARAEIEGDFLEKVRGMLGGFFARVERGALFGDTRPFVIARAGVLDGMAKKAIDARFPFDKDGRELLVEFLACEARLGQMRGEKWILVEHGNHLCVDVRQE